MTNKPVTFHDDPPSGGMDTNKYKEAINRAKAAQKDRPGELQNTPRFDQTASWKEAAPEKPGDFLSPETKHALGQLAESAKREADAQKVAPVVSEAAPVFQEPMTEEEKLKEAILKRVTPIDIGEYLMAGEAKQLVVIIPEKLEVVFKTVSDLEESYIDTLLSKEPSDMTNRQFIRKMNELALSMHIYSVNGNKWPALLSGDGNVNKDSVEVRLKNIQKLSSPIFSLLTQNLSWFLERISKDLTVSALGNG